MDPEPFELKPTGGEIERFGGAVRFGYQEMDRLVGKALDLAEDDTALVLCTAISQQPYVQKDVDGGSRFYRPHDIAAFVRQLGSAWCEQGRTCDVWVSSTSLFGAETDAAEAEASRCSEQQWAVGRRSMCDELAATCSLALR